MCNCMKMKKDSRAAHQQFTLISEIPGNRIYVCGGCQAFWMHDENEGWWIVNRSNSTSCSFEARP